MAGRYNVFHSWQCKKCLHIKPETGELEIWLTLMKAGRGSSATDGILYVILGVWVGGKIDFSGPELPAAIGCSYSSLTELHIEVMP